MSGHSKWAQIKRQKGVADVRRGALFTKLSREITIAARQGGGDPDMNFRLRLAVQKARENNMPADNIKRAIDRATGGGDGGTIEEITYEAYGPHGVAILIEAMTDNRNRTVAEVRSTLTRAGGSLGESGSVGWQFENRGLILVNAEGKDSDEIELAAIDAGAQDVQAGDGAVEIATDPADLESVRKALLDAGYEITSAELAMQPKASISLEPEDAGSVLRLLDKLEDLDDVQRVYSNADFPEEVLAAYSA
jgi:YebC/PmpR family DNA-binding regulatory protein